MSRTDAQDRLDFHFKLNIGKNENYKESVELVEVQ